MRRSAVVLLIAALASGACATPEPFGSSGGLVGAEQYFRIEWQAEESRGEPVITGYVYNDSSQPAANVRLLVEGFDGAGKQVSRTTAYVGGEVPNGNRSYFRVTVPRTATYRVAVFWWEWRDRGA
jgi:hypothetical protein